ncbi:hypothetical protein QBC44DRAFT_94342 [Cladorrhinum sp. PSN332]|nr:hypothetical protein QBC44DRAFT_94342 [Cladorrhinum sp. PSN332]
MHREISQRLFIVRFLLLETAAFDLLEATVSLYRSAAHHLVKGLTSNSPISPKSPQSSHQLTHSVPPIQLTDLNVIHSKPWIQVMSPTPACPLKDLASFFSAYSLRYLRLLT